MQITRLFLQPACRDATNGSEWKSPGQLLSMAKMKAFLQLARFIQAKGDQAGQDIYRQRDENHSERYTHDRAGLIGAEVPTTSPCG